MISASNLEITCSAKRTLKCYKIILTKALMVLSPVSTKNYLCFWIHKRTATRPGKYRSISSAFFEKFVSSFLRTLLYRTSDLHLFLGFTRDWLSLCHQRPLKASRGPSRRRNCPVELCGKAIPNYLFSQLRGPLDYCVIYLRLCLN